MLDANGCVVPMWFEFFTRFSATATQADQEAGTVGKSVTSDVQQFHPSAAKFWAKVSGDGTTLLASYNVTSITDVGAGDLTITIGTDFSSADWVCVFGISANAVALRHTYVNAQAAGSVELRNTNATPALADAAAWFVVGYGDQ